MTKCLVFWCFGIKVTLGFSVIQGKDRKDICGKYSTTCEDMELLQNSTVEIDLSASFRLLLCVLVAV